MSKFRDRRFMVRFLIFFAYFFNVILAIILTIADIITDLSVLTEFGFWLEFVTTLMLGYSSLGLSIVLSMENTKEDNDNYKLVSSSLVEINKEISNGGLSDALSLQVKHDNDIAHLKAYIVKCDRKRVKSDYWKEEYDKSNAYLKAYESGDTSELDSDYTLDNKRVRYTKIKESSLLTGRMTSSDDNDLGINTFSYVLDKKLPFLLVGMFVSVILAITTWQLAFTAEGLIDLLGKFILIVWNSIMGYILGIDIIETYHTTQMNKVRLYLRKFLDKQKG